MAQLTATPALNIVREVLRAFTRIMQEQVSTTNEAAHVDLPTCCGTGCAVCVLDYAAPAAATQALAPAPATPANERTQYCNTGCLICVRDYPELVLQTEPDTQLLQLLEAIETAPQT